MNQIDKIKNDLKETLSEYRYGHSLRVAEEASKLAKIYHIDEKKAYLAGLIHDIAKEFDEKENQKWITEYGLSNDLLKKEYHKMVHAEIGALVAHQKYHLEDDICQAIRYHTVGDIKMNLLDKIIFVADKIESGKKYPGIEEERALAYQNINSALQLCLENQRKKLETEGKNFHYKALQLLEFLKKENH